MTGERFFQGAIMDNRNIFEHQPSLTHAEDLGRLLQEADALHKMIQDDFREIKLYLAPQRNRVYVDLLEQSHAFWLPAVDSVSGKILKPNITLRDLRVVLQQQAIPIVWGLKDFELISQATDRLRQLLLKDYPVITFNPLSKLGQIERFFKLADKPPALLSKYLTKVAKISVIPKVTDAHFNQRIATHIQQECLYRQDVLLILKVVFNNLHYFTAASKLSIYRDDPIVTKDLHCAIVNLHKRVRELLQNQPNSHLTPDALKDLLKPFTVVDVFTLGP